MAQAGDSLPLPAADLVCVHRGTDPIEANLLRGMLASEGIPAAVTGADLVGGYSGVPRVCDVRLMVPARRRADADAVLERYRRARPADGEWRCTACGEANAASFESCWSCGREAEG